MSVPFYILGLLRRFGPRHGYQIDKILVEQVADFARIKLPNVYYHLDRMAAGGDLDAAREKNSSRPEKTVFSINKQGEERYLRELAAHLSFAYRPCFDYDALFYFADSVDREALRNALARLVHEMEAALAAIETHESHAQAGLPKESRPWATLLFDHHRAHYRAEAEWAQRSLDNMPGMDGTERRMK
jgi:DNA-binding PadR family transcriptional regulator